MRMGILVATAVSTLSLVANAQETTTRSETKITSDDAHVVNMTGCVRQEAVTGRYFLQGAVAAAGDNVRTQTKVHTNVNKNGTTVKSETRAGADKPIATSGVTSTLFVVPSDKVDLASYVGKQVQASAIMLKPGEDDADIKIEEKTTVDPKHGREKTSRTTTRLAVEGAVPGQYTIVSIRPLGSGCGTN